MPKKRSTFDKLTWIITELIIGTAALGYGLFGMISKLPEIVVIYIVLLCGGAILLTAGIIQIVILRKKKVKKFCSKCGEKIKKEDEFCAKCGEKIA